MILQLRKWRNQKFFTEEQIKERLENIEISDSFMDWAIREIHQDMESERDFREDKIQSFQRAHEDCRQKLDNLLKLKISSLNTDGSLLSDEKFKAKKGLMEAEIKQLEQQLGEVDDRIIKSAQEIANKFDFAAHAKERFDNTEDLSVKLEALYASSPAVLRGLQDIRNFYYGVGSY